MQIINLYDFFIYMPVTMENIAFARGGAHLPIAHALRLFLDEIEIEKK